tara:strand:+ start:62 stop:541 length:480 start_codon:yes stop_codon:yes gene_type:complete
MSNLGNWSIGNELYKWLTENLEEGKTIIEFGSGTGTIELTKKWKVYSIEHDEKWVGKAPDSNYIHAPLGEDGWYDAKKVFDNLPEKYDCIIVDGPIGPTARLGIDKHWDKFNTNVPIIFDDTDRKKDKEHALRIAKQLNKKTVEISEKVSKLKKFIVLL